MVGLINKNQIELDIKGTFHLSSLVAVVKDDKYCLVVQSNLDGICLYVIFKKELTNELDSFSKI
jgi:hypothetical protein